MQCNACTKDAVIGSRCIGCWVDRQARYYGFIDRKWYQVNRKRFIERLSYRHLAFINGIEPGSITQLKQTFSNSEKVRYNPNHSMPLKIERIVNLFDQTIKEKMDADNNSSTEG